MTLVLFLEIGNDQGYAVTPADEVMAMAVRLHDQAQAGDPEILQKNGWDIGPITRAGMARGRLVVEVEVADPPLQKRGARR